MCRQNLNRDDSGRFQTLRSLVGGDNNELVMPSDLKVQRPRYNNHSTHRVHFKLTSDVTALPVNMVADLSVLSAVGVDGMNTHD